MAEVDAKIYPWTLWARYKGTKKYVPEESFMTLEDAQSHRDRYKKETPTDMFVIKLTKFEEMV